MELRYFPKEKLTSGSKGPTATGQGKKGIGPKIVLYVRRQMKGFPAAPALDNINEKQYNGKTIENIPHRNGHALRAHGKVSAVSEYPLNFFFIIILLLIQIPFVGSDFRVRLSPYFFPRSRVQIFPKRIRIS